MNYVIFLMIAVVFVLLALLSVVATLSDSPRVGRIATPVIYGCCGAALASVLLATWFLLSAGRVEEYAQNRFGSPPQLHAPEL